MTVAVLLIGLVVTFVIGPVAAGPEGLWPLGGLCFLPLALVTAAMVVEKTGKRYGAMPPSCWPKITRRGLRCRTAASAAAFAAA